MSIFEKLSSTAIKVLKGAGQSSAAPEMKTFTVNEFAEFAAGEIEKADAESKEHQGRAIARLKSLQLSLAIAQAAFEKREQAECDIPVFSEKAAMSIDIEARLSALDSKLDSIVSANKSDDDGGDKNDKSDDAEAKAKADTEAAAKAKADEEAAAKAKADEEADKTPASKKADPEDDTEFTKTDADVWPRDLAKSAGVSDEDKELYSWGDDPKESAQAAS